MGGRLHTDDGPTTGDEALAATRVLLAEGAAVAAEWRELCRWDPELAPDAVLPDIGPVIDTVTEALNRPQPIGWGADEEVAEAVGSFTDRAGPDAVEELVCFREALSRRLRGRVPPEEAAETWARLQTIVDRAISCAARRAFSKLERAACFDALTGVMNRRSFEVDTAREVGRVDRHGGRFSVVVVDVDGLKAVNDTLGHLAGDARLQALASALRRCLRTEDTAYRIGGDEFAVLLPGASPGQADRVMARVAQRAMPTRFSWGVASYPADGPGIEAVVAVADARLYDRRAEFRGSRQPSEQRGLLGRRGSRARQRLRPQRW